MPTHGFEDVQEGRSWAVVALALLLSAAFSVPVHSALAQSAQTCTPSTCEAIQPVIGEVGFAAVQSDPEPPVFGGLMYVANTGSDSVSVIMNVTNVANVTVGQSPGEPMFDQFDGYLYVPNTNSDTISVISGSSLETTIQVGTDPQTPAFDPANEYVYVPNTGGCSVSSLTAACGDTVSVISGTSVIAKVTVGEAPQTPAIDTDSDSPYFGDVYVPNAVAGQNGGTVTVISGKTDSVVATVDVGPTAPAGAFFDAHDDEVYAADSIIKGTAVVGESAAPCNSDCVLDPYNDLIYTPGAGYPPVLQENGSSQNINCGSCGGNPVFDPANGWVYWGGYAVSGVTPFGVLQPLPGGPVLGPGSFSPTYGYVYGSCGGCYYPTKTGLLFGNVAYVFGDACEVPSAGYYYVDPANTICNGASGAGAESQSTAAVSPAPNVLGSHVFNVVLEGGVSIGYGSFQAFSTTNVVGNTQWQYVGVSFKVTGPDGQSGWTTLSIPKAKVTQLVTIASLGNLLPGSINQWKVTVFFDGEPEPAYVQYDDDNVYVSFQSHFSNHTIGVAFAEPGAPQPTAFSAGPTSVSLSFSSAGSTSTGSSTTGGGVPDLPFSPFVTAVAVVLVVLSYVLVRRELNLGRGTQDAALARKRQVRSSPLAP